MTKENKFLPDCIIREVEKIYSSNWYTCHQQVSEEFGAGVLYTRIFMPVWVIGQNVRANFNTLIKMKINKLMQ